MNRFSLWHRTEIGGFRRLGLFEDQSAARYEGSRVVAERGGAVQVHTLGRGRAVLAPAELWPHDGSCLAPPANADVVPQRRQPRERGEHGDVTELDYFGDEAAQ